MGLLQSFYREARVLMLGLDNAGKTTILYHLKLNENIQAIPTIGFNVESVKVEGMSLQIWDVGGQTTIRHLWDRYFQGSDAVVFVVDSTDTERLPLVKKELDALLNSPQLLSASFLVFCNKIDLPGSVDKYDLCEKLGLNRFQFRRSIKIFESNAKTGEGLTEGFMWLSEEVKHKIAKEPRAPPTFWEVVETLTGFGGSG